MDNLGAHRPRNVDWKRAAALLYGDLGTSKAYVIGLAFVAAKFSSFPIILAVCALTGFVAYNYLLICRHFPDGGGVYSAARDQSRLLAVMGALLLVADLTVTAAMSAWSGMSYFGVPKAYIPAATIGVILLFAALNFFGPKHSGSLAMVLAVPMVFAVLLVLGCSVPHLTFAHLEPMQGGFTKNWVAFTGVILALSGVETIANLTGVLKLDVGATMEKPQVKRETRLAILPVGIEVVVGTALLGWAMLSLPASLAPQIEERYEDMLRFLAEYYGTLTFGAAAAKWIGIGVGIVVGALLFSAVNTAVTAMIGLGYMLARDGEMPRSLGRLNRFGVPWIPLAIAACLPILVVLFATDMAFLANLYAIGVVGAITVNLGSCAINKALTFQWWERGLLALTFAILFAVEITIARTKHEALFFVICIVGGGLGLRAYSQSRAGLRTLTVSREIAAAVAPEFVPEFRINLSPGQTLMVAARGLTPVLEFALEEARLRQGSLYVLYVKEVAVLLPGPLQNPDRPRWQDDPQATSILTSMMELGRQQGVPVVPVYTVGDDPSATILDAAATLGIDTLILGGAHRRTLARVLKGNVVNNVARNLPENIQLVIYG